MLNKKIRTCLLVAFAIIGIPAMAINTLSVVPKPLSLEQGTGVFTLKSGQAITVTAASLRPAAEYLQQIISGAAGCSLKVSNKKSSEIQISLDKSLPKTGAYQLKVNAKNIQIVGKDYQGVIAGIATLRQLLQGHTIPEVKVAD